MTKATSVIYIDSTGREHDALVRALNGLNPGYITVSYVDVDAPEGDNLKTVFDIPHVSDESKDEPNPSLPTIELNCWKERYESHTVAASDHPMFDHPFAAKQVDEFGAVIEPERPGYAAQVNARLESQYPKAAEGEPAFETKHYTDGSSATGVAPLPDVSPDGAPAMIGIGSHPADQPAPPMVPSVADLDAVAAEQKAKEDTAPQA